MIAVDWGTSSLRLYRLDGAGLVLERRRSDRGVLACESRFADVLAREIAGWDDDVILMCGMAGSRGGWHEMPYLDCPAGNLELAQGMQRIHPDGFGGRELWLVPGLRDTTSDTVPDVMRGEETQLAALLDALPGGTHLACLPGTHSKWVTVRDGRVLRLATAMTGELFAVLRQHSILGRLMPADDGRFDAYAFDAGLKRSATPGGLLHQLFGVRTMGLFQQLAEVALPSYLSGLLIGHELREALARFPAREVLLIGAPDLARRYETALRAFGVGARSADENAAMKGLSGIARRAGLLTEERP